MLTVKLSLPRQLDNSAELRPCLGMPQYQSAVRERREELGISQEALARQVGVSRQTIVNIERGENEPRVFLALALAAALGVAALNELFSKGVLR